MQLCQNSMSIPYKIYMLCTLYKYKSKYCMQWCVDSNDPYKVHCVLYTRDDDKWPINTERTHNMVLVYINVFYFFIHANTNKYKTTQTAAACVVYISQVCCLLYLSQRLYVRCWEYCGLIYIIFHKNVYYMDFDIGTANTAFCVVWCRNKSERSEREKRVKKWRETRTDKVRVISVLLFVNRTRFMMLRGAHISMIEGTLRHVR